MHKNKWKFGRYFATKSAQEEFNFNGIRDDNSESITIFWSSLPASMKAISFSRYNTKRKKKCQRECLQSGGSQIAVFTFHLAVKSNSLPIGIVAQQWQEEHGFL